MTNAPHTLRGFLIDRVLMGGWGYHAQSASSKCSTIAQLTGWNVDNEGIRNGIRREIIGCGNRI